MGKVKSDIKTTDLYKKSKNRLKFKLPYSRYRNIIRDFNQEVQNEVLSSYHGYEIPFLGKIQIQGKRPYKKIQDNANSKKYRKRILHFNDHSEGYVYSIKWIYDSPIANIYKFNAIRKLKRTLTKSIRSGEIIYEKIN